MCLRAICLFSQEVFQYVDCETIYNRCQNEPERRRRQAHRHTQKQGDKKSGAEESDSDEDDVVVFERVTGRFSGGTTIRDNSIA
uniref:Uncharacterized protein n=1 Tax=Caenorhabditis japonica TaxID=281687 RepID=A0A8R1DQ11_CAEJA